ncbi:CatB-related O-acetyltransferase [Shewanella glacialipiscicola]|uniref:CatB-related O-acetyltransferase n=1 Tax=Shewanella glacialipiscicola TaxID=614069 RepID=UPI003D7A6215
MIKLLKDSINILCLKFYSIHAKVDIKTKKVRFNHLRKGIIKIKEGCYIGDGVVLRGIVNIGHYTSISDGASEINAEESVISIGNYTSIASGFFPRTSSHYISRLSTSTVLLEKLGLPKPHFKTIGKIDIGHDVWIGANVVILGGVKIGNGSVIGAGSIVNKDIPPYSIAVGNPCRVIKYRFSTEICNEIEESQWWLKTPTELFNHRYSFANDIEVNSKVCEII